MNLLIDTCDFLWLATGNKRLSAARREAIIDSTNHVFLSSVSATEVSIKYSLGKLPLPSPPATYIPFIRTNHQIDHLALDELAALRLATLPLIHRDPFDRLLICQALAHDLTFVTSDPLIHQYELPLI